MHRKVARVRSNTTSLALPGVGIGEREPVSVHRKVAWLVWYSIVEYKDMEDRLRKGGAVLATQKTVCKHLVEDSYIDQVVTDPESAQRRVENNRRVNYQKKQAIEEGRKRIGIKGRGKGVPVRALAKASIAQESGDECVETSGNTNNSPENLGQSATKRRYSDVANEDNFDAVIKESPSKRAKTHSRTKSASQLTIDTVASSPRNTIGAPRASGHRYTNSYPAYDTTLANAPVRHHGQRSCQRLTPYPCLPLQSAVIYQPPSVSWTIGIGEYHRSSASFWPSVYQQLSRLQHHVGQRSCQRLTPHPCLPLQSAVIYQPPSVSWTIGIGVLSVRRLQRPLP